MFDLTNDKTNALVRQYQFEDMVTSLSQIQYETIQDMSQAGGAEREKVKKFKAIATVGSHTLRQFRVVNGKFLDLDDKAVPVAEHILRPITAQYATSSVLFLTCPKGKSQELIERDSLNLVQQAQFHNGIAGHAKISLFSYQKGKTSQCLLTSERDDILNSRSQFSFYPVADGSLNLFISCPKEHKSKTF